MTGDPVEVEVEAAAWTEAVPDAEAAVQAAAAAAFAVVERAPGPLVVLLTDDEAVRALNARFRGKDKATNVLSFPAPPQGPANPEGLLGDVALAFGVCAAEAQAGGKSLRQHLQHLTAHGVLHLLGYDHEDDAEAEAMEAAERIALSRLGVPDPYAGEDEDDD